MTERISKVLSRRFLWTLAAPVLGLLALQGFDLLTSCGGGALTPDEAEKQLDVACGVLIRAVSNAKGKAPLAILSRVCEGKQTRALLEHLLEGPSPGDLIEATFPLDGIDGGAR
jgi:hypothetical protein